MPERNPMLAVGDTITVRIPKLSVGKLLGSIQFLAGAVAPTVVLEVSGNDQASWVAAKLVDSAVGETGVLIGALTTDGQHGYCTNPGYTDARLRVTAFTTPGSGVNARLIASEDL